MEHLLHVVLMYEQFFVVSALTVLFGRRFISCFPPSLKNDYGFYLAPILGLAFLIFISIGYGWLFPFHFLPSLILISSLAFLSIYYEDARKHCGKEILTFCIFGMVCSLPVMFFIIKFDGFNPATDIFTYLAQAQWLQEHAFHEKAVPSGYFPYLTQVLVYQGPGSRMGASFFLALLQSLFDVRWSYNIYIPTVALALSCGCLVFGAVIKQIVNIDRRVILLLCLFPAYSLNGYIFGAQWGFFPQTFGMGLILATMTIFPILIRYNFENSVTFRANLIYFLPLSFVFAIFLFSYNEPFVIFCLGLFFYFLFLLIYEKNKRLLICQLFLIFFIETVLLTNYEFVRIIRNLQQTLNIVNSVKLIGWTVWWEPWQFLAYSLGLYDDVLKGTLFKISFYLFLTAIIGISYKIFSLWKNNPKTHFVISLLFSILLALMICFVKFRYFSMSSTTGEVGATFMQFKIAKYASPFSMAILLLVIASYYQQFFTRNIYFYVASSMCIFISVAIFFPSNAVRLYYGFADQVGMRKHLFRPFLKLREYVKTHPEVEPIFVAFGPDDGKLRQLVSYVLYDVRLASDYSNDGYIRGSLPSSDVVMDINQANSMLVKKDGLMNSLKKHPIMNSFVLMGKPYTGLKFEKSEGGYHLERFKDSSWNWVRNMISNHYSIYGGSKTLQLEFELKAYPYPRNFEISIRKLDGKELLHRKLNHYEGGIIQLPSIKMDESDLVLEVSADGQAQKLSALDPRESKFMIKNIQCKILKQTS